jgi:hypothetical protein
MGNSAFRTLVDEILRTAGDDEYAQVTPLDDGVSVALLRMHSETSRGSGRRRGLCLRGADRNHLDDGAANERNHITQYGAT